MICGSFLRNIGTLSRGCICFGSTTSVLHDSVGPTYPWYCKLRTFRGSVKMMVDTGANDNKRSMGQALPEKEDDGGYASGGCKSEDGKLSCGYSSFRGKRANMEDFYDVKMSKIDGKSVCVFGIFDGETYKQTDRDFLNAEKDTFRDDGSTASTAILVGNHLYVANVGDSRTVVSKAGKGTWRVGGVLAMSRAFGNRMLKQFVVAEPEIRDAVSIARVEEEAEAAARKLTETAFTRGSADNITCIVVKFHHDKAESVNPQPEPHKDVVIQQEPTKETELGEEDCLSKESGLLHEQTKEDHHSKESDRIQDQTEIEREKDVEFHRDMETPLACLPEGSVTSA